MIKNCPHKSVVMKSGDNIVLEHFKGSLLKGNWFSIIRSTPEEALKAAKAVCSEKVTSHLPEY